MAEHHVPTKQDITTIFKRLRSSPANKQCFDCKCMNPTWASVTYGVFLCIDCSAVHRSLGVHLTFIRSTQLDTSWTWTQLRAMQIGGNANATSFFRQHGCSTTDAQQKYNSRTAHMYREKLHSQALKAAKLHGTKLHLDSHGGDTTPSPDIKDVDFFKEHADVPKEFQNIGDAALQTNISQPISVSNGNAAKPVEDDSHGPSVDAALSISPTQAVLQAEPRKSTIGSRSAKKPAGARKGKLGAQKVKANFSQVEAMAQMKDQERETLSKKQAEQEMKSQEDEGKKLASMRLAYQDLSLEQKKRDEKMKNMDPKKAAQMERLGMFGTTGSGRMMTHSVANQMKTIEQETPTKADNSKDYSSRQRDFEEDFEFVDARSSFSGPPKYNDSPFGKHDDSFSSWGSSTKTSSWDMDRFDRKSSPVEDIPHKESSPDRGRARKTYETSSSNEAQQKFGSAKAISSDQFFGGGNDPDIQMRQNLAKYEGSSSISSADLFGDGSSRGAGNRGGAGGQAGPDLTEIKEGVKQGVTKVAGRLSNLANGVINSIQDHYG